MPGADRWAELSSQNERVVQPDDAATQAPCAASARPGWDDLASQRERVVDAADPMFRRAEAYHGPAGLRLVSGAA